MSTPKSFKKYNEHNPSYTNLDNDHEAFMLLISKLNKNLEKAEHDMFENLFLEKVKNQWILLSKIIDRLLLYIFMLLTSFVLGGIILQANIFYNMD